MATQLTPQEQALADADAALKTAAAYVEATQPALDAFNVFKHDFLKRAHQIAGVLAQRGIIERHQVTGLVDKLAENPLRALDLVEKVAGMVQPESLGKTAEGIQKSASSMAHLDSFERLALYGDPHADVAPANSGLVE
jgi:hypothetical protein